MDDQYKSYTGYGETYNCQNEAHYGGVAEGQSVEKGQET